MKYIVIAALLALMTFLTAAPSVFGDGTDPMPLCRERRCK